MVADKALSEIIAASKTTESGKSDQEQEINWLRHRFINLKKENRKLKATKKDLNDKMEAVRENEKREIQAMTALTYHKSQEMQKIQGEIERLSEINGKLEQDFEN